MAEQVLWNLMSWSDRPVVPPHGQGNRPRLFSRARVETQCSGWRSTFRYDVDADSKLSLAQKCCDEPDTLIDAAAYVPVSSVIRPSM